MSCTVEITESALADMDAVYQYIRNVLQAPSAAAATYDRIADAILSLEDMPSVGTTSIALLRIKICDISVGFTQFVDFRAFIHLAVFNDKTTQTVVGFHNSDQPFSVQHSFESASANVRHGKISTGSRINICIF